MMYDGSVPANAAGRAMATAYEKAIGRPPPDSILLAPGSKAANEWYYKVQRITAKHEGDSIAAAKAVIAAGLDGQRNGHLAFTDGQHKALTALQLAVAKSSATQESVASLMLTFQIACVSNIERGGKDEVTHRDRSARPSSYFLPSHL